MFKKDELIETIKKEKKGELEKLRKEIRTNILKQDSTDDARKNLIKIYVGTYSKAVVNIVMKEYEDDGWKISLSASACLEIDI